MHLNRAIKGKLLNQYILLYTLIYFINLVFNFYYQQNSHVYVYLGLLITQLTLLTLSNELKNNKFIRFGILLIMSFLVFFFDSYYSSDAMVYLSYISIVATFPILFDLKQDVKYIVILLVVFLLQISFNFYTDFLLFRKSFLSLEEIHLRRINKVFELLFCIAMNIFFIYQLQLGQIFSYKKRKQLSLNQDLNENFMQIVDSDEVRDLYDLAVDGNPTFMSEFKKVFPTFENNLLDKAPNIILSELEVCAFIKLNMSTKEIAKSSNATVRAIEGKKYRIRRKLDLPKEVDLSLFIYTI